MAARRVRLGERDGMERGVRCPCCGRYNSFGDIVATGACRGSAAGDCDAALALDLVVDPDGTSV
jgi:hypothetical protein